MPALITWWQQDLALLAPDADPAAVLARGTDLLVRWTEPQRRYHTTQHLVEMFWALETIGQAGELDPRDEAVGRVAAWLHDAVYEISGAVDNEAASARLAASTLTDLGCPDADIDAVCRLVRASERHDLPEPGGVDAAFHDADLWILGAPPERFDEYCRQVREEYAAIPDTAYGTGRAAILRPFLERDRIYATGLGSTQWDGPARANLSRELERLAGPA